MQPYPLPWQLAWLTEQDRGKTEKRSVGITFFFCLFEYTKFCKSSCKKIKMQQLTKNNHRPKRELQEVWPHTGGPSDSQPLIYPFLSPPPSEVWQKHTATPPAGRRENIKNKQTENWLTEENCRGADYIWPLTSAFRKCFSLLPESVPHLSFDSLILTHHYYLVNYFQGFPGITVALTTCFIIEQQQ